MANVLKVNNIDPDVDGNVSTISDIRADDDATDKSKSCKVFSLTVNALSQTLADKASKGILQYSVLAGENITITKKPNYVIEISSKGGGFWHEDEITKDVTCDEDVEVAKRLTVKGNILFGDTFNMDVSKVSHTNNTPQFNPDTKQVDFVPMVKPEKTTFQQIPLKSLDCWESTYSEDGHKAQPTIIMGTGTQDYCTVTGDVLVPPKTLSITLTFTYTIKGFGWLPKPEWKPLPPITITGNIDNPHDDSGISLEFCKSDIHWSTDQQHRGSRTYTIDTSNKGLSTFSYEHMNFTFMGTGIKQDADNSWQMTGCVVEFVIKS